MFKPIWCRRCLLWRQVCEGCAVRAEGSTRPAHERMTQPVARCGWPDDDAFTQLSLFSVINSITTKREQLHFCPGHSEGDMAFWFSNRVDSSPSAVLCCSNAPQTQQHNGVSETCLLLCWVYFYEGVSAAVTIQGPYNGAALISPV